MKSMSTIKASIGVVTGLLCTVAVLQSCKSDPNSPGIEYMPDMYRSPSYETYGVSPITEDGAVAMQPVEGSIPMGADNLPYPFPNTAEGYEAAGVSLKNPIAYSENVLAEGKELYTNFCKHCHGKKGAGDGAVAKNPKWPGPPPAYDSENLKNLPEGKIFHSITYGKGLMGSHASQISKSDRWKIVHYVQSLQGKEVSENAAEEVVEESEATVEEVASNNESEETTE